MKNENLVIALLGPFEDLSESFQRVDLYRVPLLVPKVLHYEKDLKRIPSLLRITIDERLRENFSLLIEEQFYFGWLKGEKEKIKLKIDRRKLDPVSLVSVISSPIENSSSLSLNEAINNALSYFSKIKKKTLREQAYFLLPYNNYIIAGGLTEQSLFYALTSQFQMFYKILKTPVVQPAFVFDVPTFELRGTTLQVCHGQVPTVSYLKEMIIFLSRYRINVLGINFEDIFPLERYPDIGEKRGKYSEEELRDLMAFARLHYVEIMPAFQILGHLENLLISSSLRHLAEFPGANSLNLAKEESKVFIKYVYREIFRILRPRYVNLAMDEAYDFGTCASKTFVNEKGEGNVIIDYLNEIVQEIRDIAASYNTSVEIFLYHDTVLAKAKNLLIHLPRNLNIIYWNYTTKGYNKPLSSLTSPSLKEKDINLIVSPGTANWARPFPDIILARKNTLIAARKALLFKARGFITSIWGDFDNENHNILTLFPLVEYLLYAWNPEFLLHKQKGKRTLKIKDSIPSIFSTNLPSLSLEEYHFHMIRSFTKDYFGSEQGHLLWEAIEYFHELYPNYVFHTPFYNILWRHPFCGYPSPLSNRKIWKLRKIVALIEEMIGVFKKTVTQNHILIEHIEFAIKLTRFNIEKAHFTNQVYSYWKKSSRISPHFIPLMNQFITELDVLKSTQKRLWTSFAKEEGWERIEKKYNDQLRVFRHLLFYAKNQYSFISGTQRNLKYDYPLLQSEWIVASFNKRRDKKSSNCPEDHILFRKTFRLTAKERASLKYAKFQLIGLPYAKLYINGKSIGESICRFYLSPVIFDNAVKIFDVHPYLKEGKNIIYIEARAYNFPEAAANLYGEICVSDPHLGEKILRIKTDITWAATRFHKDILEKPLENINSSSSSSKWTIVNSQGAPPLYAGEIWAPLLHKDIPSRLPRDIGKTAYYETTLFMALHNKTLARFLSRILTKLF